jgi:hypothetical protein
MKKSRGSALLGTNPGNTQIGRDGDADRMGIAVIHA